MSFRVRDAVDEDRDFIENAWRASMLATCPAAHGADPKHFHMEMGRVFDRLRPSATIRVACDPKEPSNLVGFIAATRNELHYAYVAGEFRRLGVVPQMLDGLKITQMTFRTPPGDRRLKPRDRGWIYCPRWTIF